MPPQPNCALVPTIQGNPDIAIIALPDGSDATLRVRRSARAKRVAIRILPNSFAAELVLPPKVSRRQGIKFASERAAWLQDHLARLPTPVPFADGAVFPFLDRPITIRRLDASIDSVRRDDDDLIVRIARRDLSAAVRGYLRDEARRELSVRAMDMSDRIGRPFRRLTVRDTHSRWGSCSWQGDLSFSWRLIFSPEWVLDYLVAHEVSHLVHMDHSASFWRLVEELGGKPDEARRWLRNNGPGLYRYGAVTAA
jgi:predicted metal-dependent hydrolase